MTDKATRLYLSRKARGEVAVGAKPGHDGMQTIA
jgi:hypothetical protein